MFVWSFICTEQKQDCKEDEDMQFLWDMVAILGVTIASLQVGLLLSWGLLRVILSSLHAVKIQKLL